MDRKAIMDYYFISTFQDQTDEQNDPSPEHLPPPYTIDKRGTEIISGEILVSLIQYSTKHVLCQSMCWIIMFYTLNTISFH